MNTLTLCASFEDYRLDIFNSIQQIDAIFWDDHIGKLDVSKSHQFLTDIERCFPERQYRYVMVYANHDHNKLVGLYFACQYQHDLLLTAPPALKTLTSSIRKVFKNFGAVAVAMTGNLETHSQTWWFDEKALSQAQFFALLAGSLKSVFKKAFLYIVRDFNIATQDFPSELNQALNDQHYFLTEGLPLALVHSNDLTPEEYKSRLKQNYRKLVRKALEKFEQQQFSVTRLDSFTEWVDIIYPMYLNVHARAKEYAREPFSREFFLTLASAENHYAELTLILDKDHQVAAFTISIFAGTSYNPYLFGCREPSDNDPNFYYCLMWFDLENAHSKHIPVIDMGITNYFPKQNFGAELKPLNMAVSLCRPLRFLSRSLAKGLNEPQPPVRHVMR